ncbi:hypothetical protein Hamer_G001735 [Homarus americanus]|uniref:Uncharacterized protein n=1 Tax=Homarus americanus TaxID=6706 RepID=A0A8J5JQV5_HOMAM|nr:hypothetical protein Hamer_G001735 [Homarus americanus]
MIRYEESGKLTDLPRPRRPRLTSAADDFRIVADIRDLPFTNAVATTERLHLEVLGKAVGRLRFTDHYVWEDLNFWATTAVFTDGDLITPLRLAACLSRSQELPRDRKHVGLDQPQQQGQTHAWATWKAYDEVTTAFLAMSFKPTKDKVEEIMSAIECFVVLMYDRMSSCTGYDCQ